MQTTTKANLYLTLITAIWGLTFPLIRNAIDHINPFFFVFIRFSLAALMLLPLVIQQIRATNKRLVMGGLVLGTLNSLAYMSQTQGLQTIPSGRAAFITGFCVVLVPFFLPLLRLGRPRLIEIVSSLICLVGIYILTGANLERITIGDVWVFAGAIFFALTITYVQFISHKVKEHRLLTFYQVLFTAPLAFIVTPQYAITQLLNPNVIIGLCFCAIFATSLALFVQMKYQRLTTAPKAALIYSLEPLFASLTGYLLNHEPITKAIILGGSLILVSLLLPDMKRIFSKE